MNYLDSLYWIHEREKFGIKPGVKRMAWMLAKLDHPQLNIKGIHVGGTNGKGSTVAYLRAALVSNGYHVGTFTSPYIETFNERISVDGIPISDDDIVELVARVKPVSEAMIAETDLGQATEFEIITVMMFLYFGTLHPVDFVVIEAGLGVKQDSTNVFNPILSVLTSIGLDHTDILGNSYMDIIKDKSDIVKQGTTTVYAIKNSDCIKYMRDYIEKQQATGVEFDRDITIVSQDDEFTYRYKTYELENIVLNMLGEHQKENASLAITALIELYEHGMIQLDFNKMIDAIEKVSWTGRIEQVQTQPLIILDGAHNNESIDVLIETIKKDYGREKIDVLFSAIKGKPINEMVDRLANVADTFYVTDFDFPKALDSAEIFEAVQHEHKEIIDHYAQFIENYEGDGLLVTGSLYFISNVKMNTTFKTE